MSNEVEFRNLNQATELAEITENTKVVVLENGVTKQTPASNFAGGGGNNDFVVTYTDNDGTITSDKTYAEIVTAYNAGREIRAKGPEDTCFTLYRGSSEGDGEFIFLSFSAPDEGEVTLNVIRHSPVNVVVQTGTIAVVIN